MKKKYSLIFIIFLCFFVSGYGQVTTIDFETAGDGYTPSTTFGTGNTDTFNRTGTAINGNSTFHWAAEDISGNPSITLDQINVSGSSEFTFAIDLSYDNNAAWDAADEFIITYSIDGGTYQNLLAVQHINSDGFNNPAALDLNFDGNGDPGQELSTTAFVTYTTSAITLSSNSTLDIQLQFNGLTSNNEGILIDNIVITESTGTPTPSITATPTTINNLDYTFGNGPSAPQSFDVTGTLLVAGTAVTSNSTDFEVSLTAVGGYANSVNVPAGSLNGTTTIYTRLSAGLAVNTYSNTISISNATPGIGTTPTITVNGEVTPAPPANDDCSGAISLTPTATCNFVSYTNVNATDSTVPNPSCQSNSGLDVWFSTVVPASGEITVETSDNGGLTDSILAFYSGTCGSLTEIACNDDGSGLMSLATISGRTPGETIYIRVLDFQGDDEGTFDLCITTPTPCVAPTNQPTGLTLNNITGSSIDGSFTATTADDYLVVVSTSPTLGANPVNGTTYNNGDPLGSGTVVQSSNATTFTATGLSQTTQYYFFVFAYNDSSCAGGPTYNTTNPLTETATTVTGPCLSDDFNSNYGNWTGGSGTYRNTGAGNTGSGIGFNDNNDDIITSTAITDPTSLSFVASASSGSANYTINFQYSTAPGGPWTTITTLIANGSNTGDITTTFNTFNINLNLTGNFYVRILQSPRSGGSFYLDDLDLYCGTSTPEPELQLVDDSSTNQNCGYTINFGSTGTNVGVIDLTFDIENTGTIDLDVSSLVIAGTNPGDYSIVSPGTPFSITPGNTQTVTVQFTPTANGTRTAELTINNNDVDEGACVVNLTGEGVNPVPEIRVETNAGNNIPDGAGIAVVYDNNFGNETEGATSASKTYLIENLGTGNLIISSITLSTTEFTITSNPAPITLPPGDSTPVLIAFSPSTPGIKNATVTINNNDTNEATFTFAVRGNGVCGSSVMTSSPSSGPEGTIVTIIDLSTDISTATVTLNGTPLTPVTVVNNNEIEIEIPAGAQTGNLIVTNSFGCTSSFPFSFIDNQIGGCEGGTSLSEIFISEVTDATYGGLTYVELYNATGTAVNLSNYTLDLYQNGNTDDTNLSRYKTANLSGIIGINQTFIIAIGNDIYDCPQTGADGSYADLEITGGYGGLNKPNNEHDYLALLNSGVLVDEFGVFGDNDWMDSVHTTISGDRGFNFRRLNTATPIPNPSFDDNDWNIIDWAGSGSGSCTGNDYTDIGTFDFSTSLPPTVTAQPVDPTFACVFSASITIAGTEGFNGPTPTDTQELAYQWYYNAPGDATWTEILSGNTNYTGQQSATLNIMDTSNLDGYQYYCQLREDSATCFEASEAVRLSVLKSVWSATGWSELPANDRVVVIDADYDTSAGGTGLNAQTSFSACSLIVNNSLLNIDNNDFVEVINNLTVNGANGEINIEPVGSFVQINDAGTVTATTPTNLKVNKLTAPSNNWYEYTYWSSPVNGETVSNFFASAHPWRRYQYNAAYYRDSTFENNNDNTTSPGAGVDDIDDDGNDWSAISTATLIPGVGYASTHDSATFSGLPGCPGATCRVRYTFSGLFNNGVITVPLYRNDTETGDNNWNFVGNPYPSAISADAFLTTNMGLVDETITEPSPIIGGAIYLWSHNTLPTDTTNGNENINFSDSDYAIINGTGQTAAQVNGGDATIPTRNIPSGQGFFIAMSDSATSSQVTPSPVAGENIQTADLVFNNAMRVTGNNNQFFRNSTQTDLDNKLWVNLTSDNGIFSQILVGYLDNATDAYDGMFYDAPRNASLDVNAIIYTQIPNDIKKFAIQGKNSNSLNNEEIIPIGFTTSIDIATLFSFSLEQFEGLFMDSNPIYIKDNLLNITHNLKDSDYTFTSETGVFDDRFEIVFTPSALSIDDNLIDANELTIIEQANGDVLFKVSANLTITNVEILDITGRQIYNLRGNNSTEVYNLSRLSNAAYIANVALSNGQVITKKAIKQR